MSITAILTLYRRPYTLPEQAAALTAQTVPADNVWLWINHHPEIDEPPIPDPIQRTFRTDYNWKFYGRFAAALLATTEYVAIFDDDAIPGSQWFENCLATMESTPGILGTGGVRLSDRPYDFEVDKYGWVRPLTHSIEVDYVGQAWFFRREWLQYLWYDAPATWDNGEDMHFAYAARKYAGIRSYCPPHPPGRIELYGSTKGSIYDADEQATSLTDPDFWNQRELSIAHYRSLGWRPGTWPGPK